MINSHQWIDRITARLFAAENRRVDAMIEKLNQKNSEIKKKVLYGFVHMGERYFSESSKAQVAANRRQKITLPTLAFELLPEASAFISDINKLKLDRDQIKQVLFKLMYQANTIQELRDAVPEVIVPLIPEFTGISREILDPTYLIKSDWRAVRDYEKVLPKIELYAMTGMIY